MKPVSSAAMICMALVTSAQAAPIFTNPAAASLTINPSGDLVNVVLAIRYTQPANPTEEQVVCYNLGPVTGGHDTVFYPTQAIIDLLSSVNPTVSQ